MNLPVTATVGWLFLTLCGLSTQHNPMTRFLHGCPFAFPCPPPPCDNPVFGRGNCCGSCPDPEVTSPTSDMTSSTHMPTGSGPAEARVRHAEVNVHARLFQRETRTFPPKTTTSYCRFPCTHQGQHFCEPLPCHITCVDAVKPPGACCYECPNGPNCSYDGHVIPEGQNVTLPSGEAVYCYSGDIYGGNYQVFG